jgi:hypothetical protein
VPQRPSTADKPHHSLLGDLQLGTSFRRGICRSEEAVSTLAIITHAARPGIVEDLYRLRPRKWRRNCKILIFLKTIRVEQVLPYFSCGFGCSSG